MHAGDGTIYKTIHSLVWELRGNLEEKEFYDEHIVPLIRAVGFDVRAQRRSGGKNGCYGVRCCDRQFIRLFLDAGFATGAKTKTVHVPACIKEGTPPVKAAFLRGLFATEWNAVPGKSQRPQ